MIIYYSGESIMEKLRKENFYGTKIIPKNFLGSYYYLQNKPNYIKELKSEDKQK